jgi:chaperone modulatory protein CbpM
LSDDPPGVDFPKDPEDTMSSRSPQPIAATLEDALLSLDELCRVHAVSPQWVVERVEAGLLPPPPGAPRRWRFDAAQLHRVRCMARIERDFDAAPELAALVADLVDELDRLRARLRRAGLD